MTRRRPARVTAAILALAATSACAGAQFGLGAVDGAAGPEYRRAHLEVENRLVDEVVIELVDEAAFGDRRLGTVPGESSRSFDITLRSSVQSVSGSSTVEVLVTTRDGAHSEVHRVTLAPNSVSRIVVGPAERSAEGPAFGDD